MDSKIRSMAAGSPRSSVWPFLVGSGKTAPQQVILAPEFMIARHITGLLLLATGSADVVQTDSQSSTAWRCQIRNDRVDEFSLVFRVLRASPELADAPGEILLDDTSRPIYLAEGVAVIGAAAEISDGLFRRVHGITGDVFRDFWATDGRRDSPRVSAPLPQAEQDPGALPLIITELTPLTYSGPAVVSSPPDSGQRVIPVPPGIAQGVVPNAGPGIVTIGPKALAVVGILIVVAIIVLVVLVV
jgi:hypothetical protein